jgi:DNA-binding LytR/AlgR family response regulator
MKFFLEIDKEKEPSVTVICNKVTRTIAKIEALCKEEDEDGDILYAYFDEEIIPLDLAEVTCFFTRENKVYARVRGKDYVTKIRIKDVLDLVDDSFIKINQGCVANVKLIKKFSASFGGSLRVFFEDGYCDYVSRREVTRVKRRFGL